MVWIPLYTSMDYTQEVCEPTWEEVSSFLFECKDAANKFVAAAEKDVKDRYGDVTDEEYFSALFKDGPSLCGQTCAWLATGKGKELRGLFLGKHRYSSHCRTLTHAYRLSARRFQTARLWSRTITEGESQQIDCKFH